jgi:hypothetical protein
VIDVEPLYVTKWFFAFLFTMTLEVPVVVALTRSLELAWPRRLAVAITAQCASHPAVWFIWPALGMTYRDQIIASEIWAFGSETLIYFAVMRGLKFHRALLIALVANGLSYGLGVVTQRYLHWF